MAEKFAVIDTETNWHNEVMSIGVVVAEDGVFDSIDEKYLIIEEAAKVGGMFSDTLFIKGQKPEKYKKSRAIEELIHYLRSHDVKSVFAYNASFDFRCLPELREFEWHDIPRMAAYRQHNPTIPPDAKCFGTGRLKSGYRVQDMLVMFGEKGYCELHNALTDAVDELRIMKYLRHSIHRYLRGIILLPNVKFYCIISK